jgi:hypothetical protein
MILEEKCHVATPPYNSYKIVDTCYGYRIQQNLLSCLKLYITPT